MKRALIVDDDRTVCRCLKELVHWSQLGFESPEVAYSGAMALEIMKSGPPPDVVITDIRMPAMNGVALVEKIREKYPETPIFFSAPTKILRRQGREFVTA